MYKNEIDVLDELSKGACMGRDAIYFIYDKVKNRKLKKELQSQYQDYQQILDKIQDVYANYSDKTPHQTSKWNQIMTWWAIQMQTICNENTEKIAELLYKGTNMGIIEGRRILNHKEVAEDVYQILDEYVKVQEQSDRKSTV